MGYYHLDQEVFDAYAQKIRELAEMKENIENASEWDWKFVVDCGDRLRQYDRSLQLSFKQRENIDRIHEAWTERLSKDAVEPTDKRFGRWDRR